MPTAFLLRSSQDGAHPPTPEKVPPQDGTVSPSGIPSHVRPRPSHARRTHRGCSWVWRPRGGLERRRQDRSLVHQGDAGDAEGIDRGLGPRISTVDRPIQATIGPRTSGVPSVELPRSNLLSTLPPLRGYCQREFFPIGFHWRFTDIEIYRGNRGKIPRDTKGYPEDAGP